MWLSPLGPQVAGGQEWDVYLEPPPHPWHPQQGTESVAFFSQASNQQETGPQLLGSPVSPAPG